MITQWFLVSSVPKRELRKVVRIVALMAMLAVALSWRTGLATDLPEQWGDGGAYIAGFELEDNLESRSDFDNYLYAHHTINCRTRVVVDNEDTNMSGITPIAVAGRFQVMCNNDNNDATTAERQQYAGSYSDAGLDLTNNVDTAGYGGIANSSTVLEGIGSLSGLWARSFLMDVSGNIPIGTTPYRNEVSGDILMTGGSFQAYPMSKNGGNGNSELTVIGVYSKTAYNCDEVYPNDDTIGANIAESFGGLFHTGITREEDDDTNNPSSGDAKIGKAYGVAGCVALAEPDPEDGDETQGEITKAFALYGRIEDPGYAIGEAYSLYGIGDALIGADSNNDGEIDTEVFYVDTINNAVTVNGQILPKGGVTGASPTPRIEFDNDYYDDYGSPSISHIDLYMGKYGFGVSYTGGDTGDLDAWANKRHCWQIYNGWKIDSMVLDQYGLELTEGLEVGKVVELTETSDPGTTADRAKIWAKDESGTTEIRVGDSAGHNTTISPHRFELFDPDPADPLPWAYYSTNAFIGKEINVDMAGAIRTLEKLTGKQFIYVRDLPEGKKVDPDKWIEEQKAKKILEAKEAALQENPWVEIGKADALEQVDEVCTFNVPITETRHRLNPESGEVETYEKRVLDRVTKATGKKVWRIKEGIRFDETTGKFLRPRTMEEVEVDIDPVVTLPDYVMSRAK